MYPCEFWYNLDQTLSVNTNSATNFYMFFVFVCEENFDHSFGI
jgi:hypothetical protein